MILPSHYRNYWLDLSRKEKADDEKERRKQLGGIAAILASLARMKASKKP